MVTLTKEVKLGSDEPISISHEYGSLKAAQDDMKEEVKIISEGLTRQKHEIEKTIDTKTAKLIIKDLGVETWTIEEK